MELKHTGGPIPRPFISPGRDCWPRSLAPTKAVFPTVARPTPASAIAWRFALLMFRCRPPKYASLIWTGTDNGPTSVLKAPGNAESMLEEGQRTPVLLRRDGEPLVLIEGPQRLEACPSLGDETIVGILVRER